jgi:glycosyltransferase XagB
MLFTQPLVYADTPLCLVVFGAMNLLTFVLGYGVSIYAANKALGKLGIFRWWGTLASMPFYWILMCAAAWLALYQFIVCPFAWNKTEHGLSKFYRR